jgi:hypothetical protein
LNQSIDRIFSNDLTDTYTGLLENEAKEVAELYDAIKFKMGRLEKVRDPKVWEEYLDPATVDGELLDLNWKPSFDPNQRLLTGSTGGNKVLGGTGGKYTQDVKTLSQAMHIKRKFIDGKQGFVQKLNNDIWNVHLAFKHKNGEEFINNYLSDLQNKQDEIVKLYSGYQTKQNKLLTEIQQLYERSIVEGGEGQDVNSFLYAKTVLDERLKESVKRRLKSQLLRKKGYDDAFLLLQGDIEYGKTHLGEVGKLKAKYEVDADDNVRLQKIVNSVDDLNDDVYKTLLEKSTTVNDLAKKKRDTIAEIYYAMDSNGLKLEGDKSVLSKIEVRPDFSTLDEKELKFVKSLTQYQQDLLKEFANQGLHKEFEKLYYANSVGYLLRHNIGDFKLSQGVSQRLGVGQNELLGKAQQILGGRNRNKSLVSSKVSEVQEALRELNTVLETLGEPQVKLAGYITDAKGNRIPLRGFLTAQNLPKLEAESPLNLNERLLKKAQELTGLDKKSVIITEDDTIRVRNQLTRRLMSLLGVTENGTPFTDPTLIQQLSGMGVRSREDLLKLIDQIEGGLYKRSSLNTLLAANQRNFNEARKQGDALYMYNFNREDDVSLFA